MYLIPGYLVTNQVPRYQWLATLIQVPGYLIYIGPAICFTVATQVFVETLDKCFENVCELDLIFHMDKVVV